MQKGYRDLGGILEEPNDPAVAERMRVNQLAWTELTIEQRLERMRQIVKQFERSSQYHSQRIQDVAAQLAAMDEHSHMDGKVVIPVVGAHRHGGQVAMEMEKKVEGWF